MGNRNFKTTGGIKLSEIEYDDCLQTKDLKIAVLGGEKGSVIIDEDDFNPERQESFFQAVDNLVSQDESGYETIKELFFRAYEDAKLYGAEDIEDLPDLVSADELIEEIDLGDDEIWLLQHPHSQESLCIKMKLDCPWDWQHQICLVFRDGKELDYFGTDDHFEKGYCEMKSNSPEQIYYNPYEGKKPRGKAPISAANQAVIDEEKALLDNAELEIQVEDLILKRHKNGFEYRSQKLKLDILLGQEAKIILEEQYIGDKAPQDYLTAVKNLINAGKEVMLKAEGSLYSYYEETIKDWGWEEGEYEKVKNPADVWKHINWGEEVVFSRSEEDNLIYASIGSGCSWEEEHGLQIVIREGLTVNKVGPHDGHLTGSGW